MPELELNPWDAADARLGDILVSMVSDRANLPGLRSPSVYAETKSYIGFTDADTARLGALHAKVGPHLGTVVDRFYDAILSHPRAKQVFTGPEQIARQKALLMGWLQSLFCGRYDDAYFEGHARIGHTHVRVGLPQHYMFAAMEVVWRELSRIVAQNGGDADDLAALHRLLTLETTVMLDSYRSAYAERIRQLEHDAVEERLGRAEHLAEVGQLAASLAHEIKNPLAGISGAIEVLRDALEPADSRRGILNEVMRQVSRVDRTVKDLLAYARPQTPRLGECDLAAVTSRVLLLLQREAQACEVSLVLSAAVRPAPIQADEHQMEQVLMNLVLNALHASTKGGVVRVTLSADESSLTLSVSDTGLGMDEATRRRALEPFFTTKAKGTGLGLPICRRIVQAHGGRLEIASEVGRGTTIDVRIPRHQPGGESDERALPGRGR
jgi:two-component system, NtrC family, sensor histidine kinase HydH